MLELIDTFMEIYSLKLGDMMFFILVVLLVSLDVVSKLIIDTFFMNTSFSLLDGFISFHPYLNTDSMSLFNGLLLDFDISLGSLILFNIILLILMIPIYLYLKSIDFKNLYLHLMLVFLVSGSVASTIDRLIWGGSLDFLLISNYIIDLKDIYLFLSIIVAVIYLFKSLFSLLFKRKKSYRS